MPELSSCTAFIHSDHGELVNPSPPLIYGTQELSPRTLNNSDLEQVGWYLCHDISKEDNAFQTEVLHTLTSEASQEPVDLKPITVDMTQRFKSYFLPKKSNFYGASMGIVLLLAIAYICLPCTVPTNRNLFLFTTRAFYIICSTFCLISMEMLFLRMDFGKIRTSTVAAVAVLAFGQDLLKNVYLSSVFLSSLTGFWLFIFNAYNWLFMALVFVFFAWPQADSTTMVQLVCAVMFHYVYIDVLEVVTLQFSKQGMSHSLQSFFFIVFFVWCTLCQRVLQSLGRRITIGMACVAQRHVDWYDMLRSQCFLFLAYMMQGTFYRLIFVEVGDWHQQIVLISMHVFHEWLMYPLRIRPRVRERERWLFSRSKMGRLSLFPVLPMSLWIDLHYLDYFLRKLAELSTLVLFALRCVLCRYGMWIQECYTPMTWTDDTFKQVIVLSGVLFVSEMVSTVISLYFMQGERRGFVVRAVTSSTRLRIFFGLCAIMANCTAVFSDALQHVKFGN